jgi:hypothetical protein
MLSTLKRNRSEVAAPARGDSTAGLRGVARDPIAEGDIEGQRGWLRAHPKLSELPDVVDTHEGDGGAATKQ